MNREIKSFETKLFSSISRDNSIEYFIRRGWFDNSLYVVFHYLPGNLSGKMCVMYNLSSEEINSTNLGAISTRTSGKIKPEEEKIVEDFIQDFIPCECTRIVKIPKEKKCKMPRQKIARSFIRKLDKEIKEEETILLNMIKNNGIFFEVNNGI